MTGPVPVVETCQHHAPKVSAGVGEKFQKLTQHWKVFHDVFGLSPKPKFFCWNCFWVTVMLTLKKMGTASKRSINQLFFTKQFSLQLPTWELSNGYQLDQPSNLRCKITRCPTLFLGLTIRAPLFARSWSCGGVGTWQNRQQGAEMGEKYIDSPSLFPTFFPTFFFQSFSHRRDFIPSTSWHPSGPW